MSFEEWMTSILLFGALPILIVLGLTLRRAADSASIALVCAVWAFWSFGFWFICLLATERTNEPGIEGRILRFILRWGPLIGIAWLLLQHWLSRRRRNAGGFDVIQRHNEQAKG